MIAPTTPYLYLDPTFMNVNIRQLLILSDFTIRFYKAPDCKSETVGNSIFTSRSWREAILNSTHPIYYQRSQFFETINWFQNIFFHLFSIIKLQNFLPFWSPEKVCVNTNQVKYMPISVNAKCYWMLKKKHFAFALFTTFVYEGQSYL